VDSSAATASYYSHYYYCYLTLLTDVDDKTRAGERPSTQKSVVGSFPAKI